MSEIRVVTYVFCALQIISALAVIILVMFQKLKEGNGITDQGNQNASGMGLSNERKLSIYTIIFGVAFVVFTIASSTLLYQDLQV